MGRRRVIVLIYLLKTLPLHAGSIELVTAII